MCLSRRASNSGVASAPRHYFGLTAASCFTDSISAPWRKVHGYKLLSVVPYRRARARHHEGCCFSDPPARVRGGYAVGYAGSTVWLDLAWLCHARKACLIGAPGA